MQLYNNYYQLYEIDSYIDIEVQMLILHMYPLAWRFGWHLPQ